MNLPVQMILILGPLWLASLLLRHVAPAYQRVGLSLPLPTKVVLAPVLYIGDLIEHFVVTCLAQYETRIRVITRIIAVAPPLVMVILVLEFAMSGTWLLILPAIWCALVGILLNLFIYINRTIIARSQ